MEKAELLKPEVQKDVGRIVTEQLHEIPEGWVLSVWFENGEVHTGMEPKVDPPLG